MVLRICQGQRVTKGVLVKNSTRIRDGELTIWGSVKVAVTSGKLNGIV